MLTPITKANTLLFLVDQIVRIAKDYKNNSVFVIFVFEIKFWKNWALIFELRIKVLLYYFLVIPSFLYFIKCLSPAHYWDTCTYKNKSS